MSRLVCLLTILLCTTVACKAQVFWLENFTGVANGATSDAGATAWTTTPPSSGTFAKTQVLGQDVFLVDNTTTEGVWRSSTINISALGEVAIEVTLGANFAAGTDYIRAFYVVNGGPEIQFGETTGTPALVVSTAASAIVTGTSVQIVIRGRDNTAGTTSGIPNAVGFDDVSLTRIAVLYSRASGDWNNTNTWSAVGYAGGTCSCVPDDNSRVNIGNSRIVNLNVAGLVSGINVQNTGVLRWTANNLSLTMARGGIINVDAGGSMTNNATTGSSIIFNSYAYTATINGALTIGTMNFNTGSTFTVGGGGTLTAATIAAGMGTSRFVTNNITGAGASFTVTGTIGFTAGTSTNSIFNNNGTLLAAQLLFDDDNVAFNNNGTLTVSGNITSNLNDDNNKITNAAGATLNFSGIDTNLGNLLIDNSGTINQSGNFIEFDNASLFRNLATGVWNWSLTPNTGFDTEIHSVPVLNLSTAGNTFNYNGAGAQNILPLTYSNLSISNSGTKTRTAGGMIDLNGNLLIQNTAILDISTPAGTDITLGGNWTVLNTASFTEGTRTVTFDGAGTQIITNASGETFSNLTVNTTAAANTVQLSNNITISGILTLTRGGLNINGNAATLTSNAVGAIAATANGGIISETTGTPYSRVIWNMRTTTGTTYTIPFRDAAGTAIPFIFNKTSAGTESGTGSFAVSTYHTASNNTPYPSTVTNVNRFGSDNSANVADRFWIITPAGYTTNPNATVTFTVTAAEATGISSNTLRAQRWVTSWEAPIAGQTNPTPATQARVAIPGTFSVWALSGNNLPLPIRLISFTARVEADQVMTSWKTAQEIDNDFFTVQKTSNLEEFIDVGIVNGKGDSFEPQTYSLIDESPYTGKSYYRLKQTDLDGHSTYSDVVAVDYEGPASLVLKTFPNPFDGQKFNIEIKGVHENSEIPVVIYNIQGQKIYEAVFKETEPGTIKELLDLNTVLPHGMYYIRAGVLQQETRKIIVD